MSGRLFSPRQSIELDSNGRFNLRPASSKSRIALHERTPSDLNRDNGEQPTIRLVGSNNSLKNAHNKNPFPHKPAQVLQPTKASKHGYSIQNDQASLARDSKLQPSAGQTGRLSAQSSNNRYSKRSSNNSQLTTTSAADTYCNDDSFSPTSARFSMDGTLRNTPTPIASEEREKERLREEALPSVVETSFESSTIRPVTASTSSGSRPGTQSSDTTPRDITPKLQHERSGSVATRSASGSSGPNVEVYDVSSPSQYSSTPPERSSSNSYNVIHYTKSNESMTSVQYAQVRPPTAQSLSASSAWSSSEAENLPPLSVTKKRSHMHSASAGAVRLSNLSTIASESEPSSQSIIREMSSSSSADIFTSPPVVHPSSQSGNWYVRRQTIGGSSSYSSIMTDSNYQTISTESSRWELNRENSAVPDPLFSSSPRDTQQLSSPMILHPSSSGIHELSAENPSEQDDTIAELQSHPLRTQRSGLMSRGRAASEPRPISARSNHTLASLYNPDRGSHGSSIFPQWAKSFYRGKLHFPHGNESTVSLAVSDGQTPPQTAVNSMHMMPWAHHRRWESAGNSLMSLPQSQGPTPRSTSPKSSHFLPSIFRPYRPRMNMNQSQSTNSMSVVTRSSSLAELYVDESQLDFCDNDSASSSSSSTDSMAITTIPRAPRHNSVPAFQPPRRQKTVNSGRAIPRDQTYTSSNYPQSLAASHMFNTPPHLTPSRRLSHRLSTWRAPSFDEALNTLIFSRGNRQILFFCLGFLCPFLWMIAAFLPLPHRPMETMMNNLESSANVPEVEGEKSNYPSGLQVEMRNWDLERKYLKARWWRNLNRIMSFVGVAMIGAIIALAIIASK
ncbi:hypothetical protein E4T50_14674 [Aureobasidium sp. EXF-12298]|nr:hypothetical protein E4T50_14674 [Aureobasidium sp. EXF-12298]KAI4752461.1 hypothetical protein E4T51_14388 [Aureobasidium sp. EXF-12344]KAI4769663.1 hypothetical protein E4T52_15297 [Aureobasidium sp. EXF-3400]